jgi:hypothetical protein
MNGRRARIGARTGRIRARIGRVEVSKGSGGEQRELERGVCWGVRLWRALLFSKVAR